MLLRRPDVVAPRSHKKVESLQPSAMLRCIPTCRHPPLHNFNILYNTVHMSEAAAVWPSQA